VPIFEYTGRNNDKKSVSGRRIAQTADTLSVQLIKEGIAPITISSVIDKHDWFSSLKFILEGKGVSNEELSVFARQMYSLTKTGIPITSALRQLAQNTRTLRMSITLNGIIEGLESGKELVVAMRDYPAVFTPIMLSMVRVGQDSGKLDEAFLRLNQYLEMENKTLKQFKAAMRYPTFIFVSIIAATILVNIFVIPTFAKIFESSNIPLPALTQFLVNTSKIFMQDWYLLLLFVGALVYVIRKYLQSPEGRLTWDKFLFKIPLIGSIIKRIVLLRFAQAFSVIIRSGIPLVDGINLVSKAINNKYAEKEIRSMADSIQHGKTLPQAAATLNLFTPLELQMLAVSEETGELGKVLDEIAEFYQREVDYDLKRLSETMEPLLIVGMAVVVLILALAVYLPIWNMVKLVH